MRTCKACCHVNKPDRTDCWYCGWAIPAPAQPKEEQPDAEFSVMEEQPAPVPNNGPDCWEEAIELMQLRRSLGISRYKTPLQPFNGRDAFRDWLAEGLDRLPYAVQVLHEWDAMKAENKRLRSACEYALLALTEASEIESDRRGAVAELKAALQPTQPQGR